jgi:hypothetical protein
MKIISTTKNWAGIMVGNNITIKGNNIMFEWGDGVTESVADIISVEDNSYTIKEIGNTGKEFTSTITVDKSGGKSVKKTPKNMKKTAKKVKVGNVERCVYKGPRGGEYIKMNGEFKPLKSLKK